MITVEKAKIVLTETTVREILAAIEKAKAEEAPFEDTPIPDGDMTVTDYKRHQLRRGVIHVVSHVGSAYNLSYEVHLETRPHSQESRGYHLWRKHCEDKPTFPTPCPHCCGRKK
jgi:hypothetical protein